jgi:hypothetical protein
LGPSFSPTQKREEPKKIAARSNQLYTVVFRFNDDDFEDVAMTLGFSDLKDGRQFTVNVTDTWADVAISLTPLSVPGGGTVRLGGAK